MVGTENQPDLIYQAFANKGPAIQAALLSGAQDLFASLALIELVWIVGWSVAHKSDVFDMLIAVTRWAIAIGFWFFLFQNWAQMAKATVDTFRLWGNAASHTSPPKESPTRGSRSRRSEGGPRRTSSMPSSRHGQSRHRSSRPAHRTCYHAGTPRRSPSG
jgi:hypothetical protein